MLLSRRRVRKSLPIVVLCLVFLLCWCLLTLLILYLQDLFLPTDPPGRRIRRRHMEEEGEEFARGIQVVVGHYNGNVPGEKKKAFTPEELDRNEYSPVEGWGENGRGVSLNITQEVQAIKTFAINQFNLYVSDRISVQRRLQDVRRSACRDRNIPAILPSTSVIIVFHNEAFSTLLRTIHSVISRTPSHLLEEVILVDDFSTRKFLKEPLEDELRKLSIRTKVIRAKSRIGLIRARMIGAEEASGKVLTFLDSHVECTIGWMEPLLERIQQNRKAVVCPVIDVINDHTFAYQKGLEMYRGAFNWNLQFRWYSIPSRILSKRKDDPTAPIETPTMAGGLFSIDKKYFEEIGEYDHGMDIWGGENLEMSFRVWQCGGRVEIIPCSHVGHVFRRASPHDFPKGSSGSVVNANLLRVAEVWMDEWKWLFYKTAPQALHMRIQQDVSERMELRRRLQCKTFRWYLENVFTDHFFPTNSSVLCRLTDSSSYSCLTRSISTSGIKSPSVSIPCISNYSLDFPRDKLWVLTVDGRIRSDEHQCLSARENSFNHNEWVLELKECGDYDNEKWKFFSQKGRFQHMESGLCLMHPKEIGGREENNPPRLATCHRTIDQTWKVSEVEWQPDYNEKASFAA